MKTKKQFLSILLSLVMVVGLIPGLGMTAFAAEELTGEWSSGIAYSYDTATGVLTLTGNGSTTVDESKVVIDSYSFEPTFNETFSNISRIVISEGITSIGDRAFVDWHISNNLTIEIPSTVTSIGEWAFSSITYGSVSVIMNASPDNITTFYTNAFNDSKGGKFITPYESEWKASNKCSYDPSNNTITFDNRFTGIFTLSGVTYTATVTTAPAAKTLTYNGEAQALVTAGEATGGEMQYALGTKDAATGTYSASIPTATDAGTYYVWYKAKGDGTHSDTEAKCIEVTISRSNSSSAVSNKALSFTGQPQPLVNAGTVSGGTLQYALGTDANTAPTDGWSTEIPTATKPGTYYVWYKVVGDENHNGVDPACVVVTIEAAAAAPAAPESVSDYTLLASMKTSGNKAFKLKWTAVSGAEGYDVFLGDCGGECTLEKTVTGTSCKIRKLKKGNAYKAFVKAWKTENGQKVYIGEASPDVHAVAGGKSNKYTNAKKISVKKKKLTVAVGGSKKIKASLKKFSNSRRYLNHTAKIRYYSSNRVVATVDAKGKVTGVAPGTCTVYAVAENGLRKGVKITVK